MPESHRLPEPAVLIFNPNAGPSTRKKRRARLFDRLERVLPRLSIRATEAPGDATRLAREAHREGARTVLVAGGDGTVNEALQGLVGTDVHLGTLPLGTANVLSRETGIPADPERAVRAILSARGVPVTVGTVRRGEFKRHFVLMAGVGLDAAIVGAVRAGPKKRLGVAAYFLEGMATALTYRYPKITVEVNGVTLSGTSLVVANARNYAGPFILAPDAGLMRDGLTLVLFSGRGPAPYLKYAAGVVLKRHGTMQGVTILHGDHFRVVSEAPTAAHVDGEEIGAVPLEITANPQAVRLLISPAAFTGQGIERADTIGA
ncbi:MAG: diacylglycerol/lipid kinase family protein [Leptospirillia bacterium]